MNCMTRKFVFSILVTLVLGMFLPMKEVFAAPPMPATFWGQVTVGGTAVSEGTSVTAFVDGMQCGSTNTVSYNGESNWYVLDCIGDDPDTGGIEGGQAGQSITFEVDGVQADQTATWKEGAYDELNLTAEASIITGSKIFLEPSDITATEEQNFLQYIKVSSDQMFDTVGAHINIDTLGLVTVVDASGVAATSIDADPQFAGNVIFNRVDNTTGQIDFSITRLDNPLPAGEYTIATIRYKVNSGVTVGDTTTVSLVRDGARYSDVVYQGNTFQSDLEGGTVTIGDGLVLNGLVEPTKYRGIAGTSRWITDLFWGCAGPGTEPWSNGIIVRNAGAPDSDILGTFPTTTDKDGHFTVLLTGIAPGVYDITVKGDNTLAARVDGVTLPSANPVDFGLLRVGDSDGSNTIDHVDLSYVIAAFLSSKGESSYRHCSDNNRDDYVNVVDASTINKHFLQPGPSSIVDDLDSLSNVEGASLTLSELGSMQAGEIATTELSVNTGNGKADTIGAHIFFNPSIFEVVNADGEPISSIDLSTDIFKEGVVYSSVDHNTGYIDIAATLLGEYFEGTVTIADIHLKAKQDMDMPLPMPNLAFVREGARHSDVLLAGESLNPEIDLVTGQHNVAKVYLPMIKR